MPEGSLPIRTCGTGPNRCTACCKTHPLDPNDGFLKKPGIWCTLCKKGGGCTVYGQDTRPSVCGTFACDWLKGKGDESDRPDQTKVVFETQVETIAGTVLVMWEVAEGALGHAYATHIRDTTVGKAMPVLSIYCNGNRTLRIPQQLVDSGIVDCQPILDLGIRVEIDLSVRPASAELLV